MFNLPEKLKKIKSKIKPIENDVILIFVIILVAFISFGLGRLSKIRENKTPITIENLSGNISASQSQPVSQTGEKLPASPSQGGFVASKSGTKYHYPWCPGVLNIKEENKIWFSTKEQAAAAGYTPAGNCKGL